MKKVRKVCIARLQSVNKSSLNWFQTTWRRLFTVCWVVSVSIGSYLSLKAMWVDLLGKSWFNWKVEQVLCGAFSLWIERECDQLILPITAQCTVHHPVHRLEGWYHNGYHCTTYIQWGDTRVISLFDLVGEWGWGECASSYWFLCIICTVFLDALSIIISF